MRLIRLAIVRLTPARGKPPKSFKYEHDRVQVMVTTPPNHVDGDATLMVLRASVAIDPPPVAADGTIEIPEAPRLLCETAISRVADMLAISNRCSRDIVAPPPSAALAPDTDDDRAYLASLKQIRGYPKLKIVGFGSTPDVKVATHMDDRWPGVSMLAEAFSHSRKAGRYRELVRFFEMAFGKQFTHLRTDLANALMPAMGYTRGEIASWQNLRNPYAHADGKKTKRTPLESDAQKITLRMEQAALDILCNKAEWGNLSPARRDVWRPTCFTTSPDRTSPASVQADANPTVELEVKDAFDVFNGSARLKHTGLPADWFTQFEPHPRPPEVASSPESQDVPIDVAKVEIVK